jgi:hypothetical protein
VAIGIKAVELSVVDVKLLIVLKKHLKSIVKTLNKDTSMEYHVVPFVISHYEQRIGKETRVELNRVSGLN